MHHLLNHCKVLYWAAEFSIFKASTLLFKNKSIFQENKLVEFGGCCICEEKLKLVADIWAFIAHQVLCNIFLCKCWCRCNFTWSDFSFCPKSYSGVCKCTRWRKRFLSVLATSQNESSARNVLCRSDMYCGESWLNHILIAD